MGISLITTTIDPLPLLQRFQVFETINSGQIRPLLEQAGLLSDRPYGFRSRRPTDDLLAAASHSLSVAFDSHG